MSGQWKLSFLVLLIVITSIPVAIASAQIDDMAWWLNYGHAGMFFAGFISRKIIKWD